MKIYKIFGRPISKKNSKRLIKVGGKTIPISSKAYLKFEKDAVGQIFTQFGKVPTPIKKNLHVRYDFYIKGKFRVDLDNLIASMNDILQKAKVIEDDNLITFIAASKENGSPDWFTQITILREE